MKTKLMGILNVTPDSYVDGGRYFDQTIAIQRGVEIYREGADLIDVGGESTRPGAEEVTEEEELRRVIPVIKALAKQVPIPLSIDTCKPKVAAQAIDAGACFINDVTGFSDPAMQELAVSSDLEICVMHMQGSPRTMQQNPDYPEGVVEHLIRWFDQRVSLLLQRGVKPEKIYLDPGIGFGKTVEHNLEIIQSLARLKELGFPLLLGVSRKSFMRKILNKPTQELLPATLALSGWLIHEKVAMLRVHDVQAHRDAIELVNRL